MPDLDYFRRCALPGCPWEIATRDATMRCAFHNGNPERLPQIKRTDDGEIVDSRWLPNTGGDDAA